MSSSGEPFEIGAEVWTRASGPWTVIARYRNKVTGEITYDLRYANGVELDKWPAKETFATRQHWGIKL